MGGGRGEGDRGGGGGGIYFPYRKRLYIEKCILVGNHGITGPVSI